MATTSCNIRSEERFSRNAETDIGCRLLLEKKGAETCPSRRRSPRAVSEASRHSAPVRRCVVAAKGVTAGRAVASRGRHLQYAGFFFNDTATPEIYPLSLHDALPIFPPRDPSPRVPGRPSAGPNGRRSGAPVLPDRKSGSAGMPRPISYAVFCLKKRKTTAPRQTTCSPPPAHPPPRRASTA